MCRSWKIIFSWDVSSAITQIYEKTSFLTNENYNCGSR